MAFAKMLESLLSRLTAAKATVRSRSPAARQIEFLLGLIAEIEWDGSDVPPGFLQKLTAVVAAAEQAAAAEVATDSAKDALEAARPAGDVGEELPEDERKRRDETFVRARKILQDAVEQYLVLIERLKEQVAELDDDLDNRPPPPERRGPRP